jgi:zinc D-Ala-D-Ala carboxypeptidase
VQLTPHFTLEELSVSAYGARNGLSNIPPPTVHQSLKLLCLNVLEPLRTRLGKSIVVLSGYRSPAINRGVGGAATSQHMVGEAADIYVPKLANYTLAQLIIDAGLPFDQVILEFGQWVHVSYDAQGKQRGQILTAVKQNGKTVYLNGLHQ